MSPFAERAKPPRATSRSSCRDSVDPTGLFEGLASPAGLTEHASTFGRAEVVKEIAAALPEGGTRHLIEHLAETFLNTRDVVPVLPGRTVEDSTPIEFEAVDEPVAEVVSRPMRRRDGTLFPGMVHRQYTTVELLVTEQRVIEQAIGGIGAGRWTAPHRLVDGQLRRHRHLTEGQREMVRRFATSTNAIDIGIGPAGTGKVSVTVCHFGVNEQIRPFVGRVKITVCPGRGGRLRSSI